MNEYYFSFQINTPTEEFLQQYSSQNPYWGKVWHSAIALSEFIIDNPVIFKNKKVLELAGGLGLPSFVVSKYAQSVICSDISLESISYIKNTILQNKTENIQAVQIDWNLIPVEFNYDIVLLSDVNYDQSTFSELKKVITDLITQQKQIILATPQRLLAKPFIEWLVQFRHKATEKQIHLYNESKYISIFDLQ